MADTANLIDPPDRSIGHVCRLLAYNVEAANRNDEPGIADQLSVVHTDLVKIAVDVFGYDEAELS